MKKLFDEYMLVILTFISIHLGIEVVIQLFSGKEYIELIIKEFYGL